MRRLIVGTLLLVVACVRSMADIEADAKAFAEKMDGKPAHAVECVNRDSDWDGYVSCTVFRVDRDPYAIQCASASGGTGCKVTMPRVRVQP